MNVKLAGKLDLQAPAVREAVAQAEADLAGRGRVLLRPSGTEPVVRVMVEGEDRAHVQELAETDRRGREGLGEKAWRSRCDSREAARRSRAIRRSVSHFRGPRARGAAPVDRQMTPSFRGKIAWF